MDETIRLILEGCHRAKILEASLQPNAAYQPDLLFRSCTEIVKFFSEAKERLESIPKALQAMEYPAMDLLHDQLRLGAAPPSLFPMDPKMKGVVIRDQEAAAAAAPKKPSFRSGGEEGAEVVDASPSVPRGSSSQRQRRRTEGRVRRVRAPQMGNTEIPPEDGYTWRKYGQKAIQDAVYPRSYFRCTHQKLYNCPAKRQVQRLDHDPTTFEVTYLGDHTCHLSSTAPSGPPPPSSHPHQPPIAVLQQVQPHGPIPHQPHQIPTAGVPLTFPRAPTAFSWLNMEINTTRGLDPGDAGGQHIGPSNTTGVNALATGPAAAVDVAGPSTSRTPPYGRERQQEEVEYYHPLQQPVADMADAMFKSGSSSNNSMDHIFSPMDDKWDSGEKKN